MNIKNAIPSALTCANLVCGFLVFIVDINSGIWLILLGALFDVFDGAVARWLNAQSKFGGELDSLADMVTFGAAPAFLIAHELDENWEFLSVIIVVTAALRLARFNISGGEQYYFKGLAVPASALFFLGLIIFNQNSLLFDYPLFSILFIFVALLNVSSIKMFSFKGLRKDKWTGLFLAMTMLSVLIASFVNLASALFIGMSVYIILSVIYHFLLGNPESNNNLES